MGAFVEHSFDRGFLLDEGRLRRIRDILNTRLAKHGDGVVVSYKVFRGDSHSYETDSIDAVTREDHEDWRRMTRLDVLARAEEPLDLKFRLTFSKSGCKLNITGEDRDDVFLLFSDLREYIGGEVAVAPSVTRDHARSVSLAVVFLGMTGMILTLFYLVPRVDEEAYTVAIDAQTAQEKLNFLIERNKAQLAPGAILGWFTAILVGMLLMTTRSLERAVQYLFPGNEFLFGKRESTFGRRKTMFGRIFWGVGVALVVGVVGSLVAWYMTRAT